MPSLPKTRDTTRGDVHIACQVTGERPIDLVVVPGFVFHLEYQDSGSSESSGCNAYSPLSSPSS